MDGLASISVIIAALSLVFGVYAWKREYVGKRRIELAQSVLAMFYEADDAIMAIMEKIWKREISWVNVYLWQD